MWTGKASSRANPLTRPFHLLSAIVLAILVLSLITKTWILLALPFAAAFLYIVVIYPKTLNYLLWASLPISFPVGLPNGWKVDVPAEPLLLIIMAILIAYGIYKWYSIPAAYLLHPISLLLLFSYLWMWVTVLPAEHRDVAVKFGLAKTWYLFGFYIGALYFIHTLKDIDTILRLLITVAAFTIVYTLVRHAQEGFSYVASNMAPNPFYKNHVDYATHLAVIVPYLWYYLRTHSPRHILTRAWWHFVALLFIVGIALSYTRAAYVALLLMLFSYVAIRLRAIQYFIMLGVLLTLGLLANLATNNRYLDYAPQYEKTIAHRDFLELLEATPRGQDLSTMERVHRWIAGFYMMRDRPLFGFGPNNFYESYKPYTVSAFHTYVSHNPEQSGIHNYFLLLAVEQGIPAMLLFIALCFFTLFRLQQLYHHLESMQGRAFVMSAALALTGIVAILLINDMIETIKIGPFFYFILATILLFEIKKIHHSIKS